MPIPKSVIKIKKANVEYVSSVDRCKYTLVELQRAALRDIGKFLRKRIMQEIKKMPGMKRAKRPYNSTQYWVRKKETDLQIGFKHDSWYGARQELGEFGQPARHILRRTVYENIPEIVHIESKYLSAMEDEALALAMMDENDEGDNEDDGT